MCGRYTLFKEIAEVDAFLNSISRIESYERYNITPSATAPVAFRNKSGALELRQMHWGLHAWPTKEGDMSKSYRTFNARDDKLTELKTWKRVFPMTRCLIPFNGFYEWTGPKGDRIPHYIQPTDQPLFVAAGLWSPYSPRKGVGSFSMITVEANEFMKPIHEKGRMPALLHPIEFEDWLHPDHSIEYLLNMLQPFPDESMKEFITSQDVNAGQIDEPYLIEPV